MFEELALGATLALVGDGGVVVVTEAIVVVGLIGVVVGEGMAVDSVLSLKYVNIS